MDRNPVSVKSAEPDDRRVDLPRGDGSGGTKGRTGAVLAAALREAREELVRRWLDRIIARVAINPNRVFPTEELLNHVPILIDGIANYLEHPEQELDAEVPVTGKAMELGALRHTQGFD